MCDHLQTQKSESVVRSVDTGREDGIISILWGRGRWQDTHLLQKKSVRGTGTRARGSMHEQCGRGGDGYGAWREEAPKPEKQRVAH